MTDPRTTELLEMIPFAAELGIELLEVGPDVVSGRKGRTLIVLETEVTRDDGKLAAKVTQTQIYHSA
jgi:acyl-coenzyme A thioesterase PaaI-like protein